MFAHYQDQAAEEKEKEGKKVTEPVYKGPFLQ